MIGFYIFIGIITIIGVAFCLNVIFHPNGKTAKQLKKLLDVRSPSGDIGNEKKAIKDMTYTEFTVYVYSNSIYPVTSYDDFDIYYIDGHYYYHYTGLDKDEFYEVDEVAALDYSCVDDFLLPDSTILSTLFECDVCGEVVTDDRIYYGWYKKVGGC